MAIIKNAITFGSGFNITAQGPIDSRMRVETVADLTSVWGAEAPAYVGMVVTVSETGDLYVLVNEDAAQKDSWKRVGSDGLGTVTAENYSAAIGMATKENVGQIIYVLNEEGSYTAGPYVVSGAGTVSKLGTTSATGDIEGDVEKLKGDVSTLQGKVTELEKLDDLVPTSGLKKETDGSLAIKVDPAEGNALTIGAGGLKVTEVPYTGNDAINVKNKSISLKINDADKVLSQSTDGLTAALGLSYDSASKLIKLTGTGGELIQSIDATDFIKDGMVDNVSFDPSTKKLTITFNTSAGKEDIEVDLTSLVDTYTAGNGITIEGNTISSKLDNASEAFLTIGAGGIKLSGVQSAISSAVNAVDTKVAGIDARLKTAEGEIDALQAEVGSSDSGIKKDVADLKSTVGNAESGLVKDMTDVKTAVGDSNSGLVKDVADLKTGVAAIKVKDVDTTTVAGIQLGLDPASSKVKINSVSAAQLGIHVSPEIDATKVKLGADITDGAEEDHQVIIPKNSTLPEAIQSLSDKVETAIAGGITGISGDSYIRVSGSATSKSLTLDAVAVGKAMPATGSAIVADSSTGKLDLFWDVIE